MHFSSAHHLRTDPSVRRNRADGLPGHGGKARRHVPDLPHRVPAASTGTGGGAAAAALTSVPLGCRRLLAGSVDLAGDHREQGLPQRDRRGQLVLADTGGGSSSTPAADQPLAQIRRRPQLFDPAAEPLVQRADEVQSQVATDEDHAHVTTLTGDDTICKGRDESVTGQSGDDRRMRELRWPCWSLRRVRHPGARSPTEAPPSGCSLLCVAEGGFEQPALVGGLLAAALTAPHLVAPWLAARMDRARDGRWLIAGGMAAFGVLLAAATLALGRLPLAMVAVLVVLAGALWSAAGGRPGQSAQSAGRCRTSAGGAGPRAGTPSPTASAALWGPRRWPCWPRAPRRGWPCSPWPRRRPGRGRRR